MYPSTIKFELRSRRAARRIQFVVAIAAVFSITLLGSLSLFVAAINN